MVKDLIPQCEVRSSSPHTSNLAYYEAISCVYTPSSMRWLYLKVHMLPVKEKMQMYF
jgi:hypothetical protein